MEEVGEPSTENNFKQMEARLEGMLEQAKTRFDSWKDTHMNSLNEMQTQCTKGAEVSEARIKELYTQEKALLQQAKTLAQDQGVSPDKLADVDREIASLNAKLQGLMSASLTTEHQVAQEEKKIAEVKATIARYQQQCEQYRLEKELGQLTYETRLGLRFERVEDDFLRVVFTHIDPADALKEHSVVVCVDSDNVYQIPEGSCKPALPELDSMLEALRASNDFPGFVRKLRARFVASAIAA